MLWLERGATDTFAFNLALALIRLERCAEAEQALSRAIRLASGAKDRGAGKRLNEYRSALRSLRSQTEPIIWWNWWFAQGGPGGWLKRIVAGCSLLLLGGYVLLPLVAFNTDLLKIQGRAWWVNVGAGWESYLVPVATILIVLLSPMLRKLGPQGIKLSPIPPPPESKISRKLMDIQPELEP